MLSPHKIIMLIMILITISNCSSRPRVTVIPGNKVQPVYASEPTRCWMQSNYNSFPNHFQMWLKEQSLQERLLRKELGAQEILPPPQCN